MAKLRRGDPQPSGMPLRAVINRGSQTKVGRVQSFSNRGFRWLKVMEPMACALTLTMLVVSIEEKEGGKSSCDPGMLSGAVGKASKGKMPCG